VTEQAIKTEDLEDENEDDSSIKIFFFKSDTCAFCPRAEEVVQEVIDDFNPGTFKMQVINVSENPEAAEKYGIFALPTVMIGGLSITGIPEPEMLLKMILTARVQKKRGDNE
jgi:thiol-disulfide isomerase/thioredoxin